MNEVTQEERGKKERSLVRVLWCSPTNLHKNAGQLQRRISSIIRARLISLGHLWMKLFQLAVIIRNTSLTWDPLDYSTLAARIQSEVSLYHCDRDSGILTSSLKMRRRTRKFHNLIRAIRDIQHLILDFLSPEKYPTRGTTFFWFTVLELRKKSALLVA